MVVKDGRMLERVVRDERLSDSELLEGLREQGIDDLSRVSVGLLEPDGTLSFFTGQDHQPPQERAAT